MREIASAIQKVLLPISTAVYNHFGGGNCCNHHPGYYTWFCSCDRFCHWGGIIRHSWICWDECLSSRKCAYSSIGYRWFGASLNIAFKSGAVTGMLVVGLGLLGVAGYYLILLEMFDAKTTEGLRHILEALVALSFGASLISIFARLVVGFLQRS